MTFGMGLLLGSTGFGLGMALADTTAGHWVGIVYATAAFVVLLREALRGRQAVQR